MPRRKKSHVDVLPKPVESEANGALGHHSPPFGTKISMELLATGLIHRR